MQQSKLDIIIFASYFSEIQDFPLDCDANHRPHPLMATHQRAYTGGGGAVRPPRPAKGGGVAHPLELRAFTLCKS